ncbi:Panacea domain-containing protein [Pantoea sp. ME81]|uniref:Panacea domain-containing protein n=1 Tax=Pantoea sp. ME81 TaxID=2743935 RepID=UPI0015F50C8D|nr:Panacea domain-containing protein [Pantoea sp. ME81]
MLKTRFDSEKALEAILYVASKAPIPDLYHVGKLMYFADRKHLERYGRLITGDNYKAMKNGPVASGAYDLLKLARGDVGQRCPAGCTPEIVRESLVVSSGGDHAVNVKRDFNADFLSKSDIICLDEAIAEYGTLTFGELNDISHDDVWRSASRNDEIPLEVIAAHSKNGQDLLEYLHG